MRTSCLLLPLFPLVTVATLNGHCTGTKATGDWKKYGICIKTTTCNSYDGVYKTGACPDDPDGVKCCLIGLDGSSDVNPCGGISYCEWTSNACSGSFEPSKLCSVVNVFWGLARWARERSCPDLILQ